MIAVDTNILVYSHRTDSPFHEEADAHLTELAQSGRPWAIPWPCVHEFFCITTHPRVYSPPTPVAIVLEHIEGWIACPSFHLLAETEGNWPVLKEMLSAGHMTGPRVHDARIAAICKAHRVSALWSADRDFSRVSGLKIVNPLLK